MATTKKPAKMNPMTGVHGLYFLQDPTTGLYVGRERQGFKQVRAMTERSKATMWAARYETSNLKALEKDGINLWGLVMVPVSTDEGGWL